MFRRTTLATLALRFAFFKTAILQFDDKTAAYPQSETGRVFVMKPSCPVSSFDAHD
ncbi:MAG TPA: hypothetical protein VL996_14790 [Methylocella sp.]|nr:hypothetical protein [Methylocella sp.]